MAGRNQKVASLTNPPNIDPTSPIDTESEDNDHESNEDNIDMPNFKLPKKQIKKPKGPFRTNEKLKYTLVRRKT